MTSWHDVVWLHSKLHLYPTVRSAGDGTGIMFLNEVALGKEHHIIKDNSSLTKPPDGFDSIIAKGHTEPGKWIISKNVILCSVLVKKIISAIQVNNNYYDCWHHNFSKASVIWCFYISPRVFHYMLYLTCIPITKDPSQDTSIVLQGKTVTVPQGKPITDPKFSNSNFFQSEYLVYKESQARIRYLLKLKFWQEHSQDARCISS